MRRLPLSALEVFAAIAREGSLKAAADALGLKPSTVSHQLKTLEARLGTALFIRTTRSVSLTEAGRALFRGAGLAFEQLHEAVESAQSVGLDARGQLRLALPEFVYHLFISPILPSFRLACPEIEVDLRLTDAFSDIVGEGLHAGFRLGDRIAQGMVAVRISPPLPLAVLGSPEYFTSHGRPTHPRDLLGHHCARYRFQSSGHLAPWTFFDDEGEITVDVQGKLIANTLPALVDFACQGLGLVYTFEDFCRTAIAERRLKAVLEGYLRPVPGVFLYFPREYRSLVPLRCFLDHLKAANLSH